MNFDNLHTCVGKDNRDQLKYEFIKMKQIVFYLKELLKASLNKSFLLFYNYVMIIDKANILSIRGNLYFNYTLGIYVNGNLF